MGVHIPTKGSRQQQPRQQRPGPRRRQQHRHIDTYDDYDDDDEEDDDFLDDDVRQPVSDADTILRIAKSRSRRKGRSYTEARFLTPCGSCRAGWLKGCSGTCCDCASYIVEGCVSLALWLLVLGVFVLVYKFVL